jgi:hypothetical protein
MIDPGDNVETQQSTTQSNENQQNNPRTNKENQATSNLLMDTDFILLILILLTLFQKPNIFSEKFKLLTDELSTIQDYLETTDATLQALEQATQIPNQKLN